jgi:hypothetical protein
VRDGTIDVADGMHLAALMPDRCSRSYLSRVRLSPARPSTSNPPVPAGCSTTSRRSAPSEAATPASSGDSSASACATAGDCKMPVRDLTDEEAQALLRLVRRALDGDRYPMAPRLDPLKGEVLAELDLPKPAPLLPPPAGGGPSSGRDRRSGYDGYWEIDV